MHVITLARHTTRAIEPATLEAQIQQLLRAALPPTTLGRNWRGTYTDIKTRQILNGWDHRVTLQFYRLYHYDEQQKHLNEFSCIREKLVTAGRSSRFGDHPWESVEAQPKSVPAIQIEPIRPYSNRYRLLVGTRIYGGDLSHSEAHLLRGTLAQYQRDYQELTHA